MRTSFASCISFWSRPQKPSQTQSFLSRLAAAAATKAKAKATTGEEAFPFSFYLLKDAEALPAPGNPYDVLSICPSRSFPFQSVRLAERCVFLLHFRGRKRKETRRSTSRGRRRFIIFKLVCPPSGEPGLRHFGVLYLFFLSSFPFIVIEYDGYWFVCYVSCVLFF